MTKLHVDGTGTPYQQAYLLLRQVYAFVNLAFAGRVAEMVVLVDKDVTVMNTVKDGTIIKIEFDRVKKAASSTDRDSVFITCPVAVARIIEYLEWKKGALCDRLFMQINSDGSVKNQPVGKNALANFAEEMAEMLGISDSHLFSSHSFRRSSISALCAEGIK